MQNEKSKESPAGKARADLSFLSIRLREGHIWHVGQKAGIVHLLTEYEYFTKMGSLMLICVIMRLRKPARKEVRSAVEAQAKLQECCLDLDLDHGLGQLSGRALALDRLLRSW